MTCGFSMDHYREILTSALEIDYKFVGFTQTDLSGDRVIYLRHDVDLSFLCAVEMAEVEASLGIRSTYLFLNNSPFYSLHEDRVIEGISRLRKWVIGSAFILIYQKVDVLNNSLFRIRSMYCTNRSGRFYTSIRWFHFIYLAMKF